MSREREPWFWDWFLAPARVAMLLVFLSTLAALLNAPSAPVVAGLVVGGALLLRALYSDYKG